MSPKDRIHAAAAQMQTVHGWSLNDRAFHATFAANPQLFARFNQAYCQIKAYYLGQGHNEQQWQAVSSDPRQFNCVWRQSLGLPLDTTPPPMAFRRALPSFHSATF